MTVCESVGAWAEGGFSELVSEISSRVLVRVQQGLESMLSSSHGENKSFVAASFTEAVPTGERNERQSWLGF